MATPCEYVMGDIRLKRVSRPVKFGQVLDTYRSLSFSIVCWSSRRSSLVPTSTIWVDGAWCVISGYHWSALVQIRSKIQTDFCLDVLIARGTDKGETDQENVRLGV